MFGLSGPSSLTEPGLGRRLASRSQRIWRRRSLALKRTFDLALVVPTLLLVGPLWLLVALLIKLESPGPVLFRQTRIGHRGRRFTMYKFRSMYADAEKLRACLEHRNEMRGGVTFKMREDPRVTFVGRVLRRWSLDETPQFLNVLLGEMSFVGPRPPLPEEVSAYAPEHRRRLDAVPGLTCLWQIAGRSELAFPEQVAMDLHYIRQRSLWLDLLIILRTIPAVCTGRGAY